MVTVYILTHTNPTEFVFAYFACHVVAALILLNASLTVRALSGVRENPVRSLALIRALQRPVRQLAAGAGVVGLFAALEAVRVTASTAYGCDAATDGHSVATRCGTVFHVFAHFHEITQYIFVVLLC